MTSVNQEKRDVCGIPLSACKREVEELLYKQPQQFVSILLVWGSKTMTSCLIVVKILTWRKLLKYLGHRYLDCLSEISKVNIEGISSLLVTEIASCVLYSKYYSICRNI